MDKTSILFVDDEEQLLFGLRRMLREKRQDWDMQFVGSGKEALEVMSKNPSMLSSRICECRL